MSKRRRQIKESLPRDLVENIQERLPINSLMRFRGVSKHWKSTIEKRSFRGSDLVFICFGEDDSEVAGSSLISHLRFPTFGFETEICLGSCEGLVCLYDSGERGSLVVNPSTGWQRRVALSNVQRFLIKNGGEVPKLGFGKDQIRGVYKLVWLYNSFDGHHLTTCEVYDFQTSSWRYVFPSSPHRVLDSLNPVYLDGSVYWFTEGEETKVLSFDIHQETFQVVSTTPFTNEVDSANITMCILENRLCVSEKTWPSQHIWSFESLGGSNTWKKLCTIDLWKTTSWFRQPVSALSPIAILDKNRLLLQCTDESLDPLVIYDLTTKSYGILFTPTTAGTCVAYSKTAFSIVDGM